jgi:hypothetical protein
MNCPAPCFGFVLSASIPFHHQPQQQPQSEIPVADYFARFEMKTGIIWNHQALHGNL